MCASFAGCGDDDPTDPMGGPDGSTMADAGTGMDGGDSDGGSSSGPGSVSILLEAEDTITEGLAAGEGDEDITDGWAVTFDDYIVIIGDIQLQLSSDTSTTASASDVFAYDLVDVPEGGVALWDISGLALGNWNFNYSTPAASASVIRDDTVSSEDFDMMVAAGATYLVRGTLSQTGGESCPPTVEGFTVDAKSNGNTSGGNDSYDNESITFEVLADAATAFGPCEIDEMPGFAATESGATVAATIHGDHLYFNGFPEGDESGVTRLAQWWADADLNVDGVVTQAELEEIAPADLPIIDKRYALGGSPITPLDTMWTYVRAQLATQGHFQGEGECPGTLIAE